MSKAIASFAIGAQAPFLPVVVPRLAAYAANHGYNLVIPTESEIRELCNENLPASWLKVPLLLKLLSEHREAVWIDADVVVDPTAPDILDELRESDIQGLVFHEVDVGRVPNCGVWVLRREMLPWLKTIWESRQKWIGHGTWWEQSALIEAMGVNPSVHPLVAFDTNNHLFRMTASLRAVWNWHKNDQLRSNRPYFAHATMTARRLAVLREWAAHGFQNLP